MPTPRPSRLTPWAALALLACGVGPPTEHEVTDIASACVDGDQVAVRLATCLSSSCDTLLASACAATLDGDTVTVTAAATIRSEGGDCTADCGLVEVRCPLPDGAEAATTLAWGDQQAAIDAACDLF
jgi:hypothetical protein